MMKEQHRGIETISHAIHKTSNLIIDTSNAIKNNHDSSVNTVMNASSQESSSSSRVDRSTDNWISKSAAYATIRTLHDNCTTEYQLQRDKCVDIWDKILHHIHLSTSNLKSLQSYLMQRLEVEKLYAEKLVMLTCHFVPPSVSGSIPVLSSLSSSEQSAFNDFGEMHQHTYNTIMEWCNAIQRDVIEKLLNVTIDVYNTEITTIKNNGNINLSSLDTAAQHEMKCFEEYNQAFQSAGKEYSKTSKCSNDLWMYESRHVCAVQSLNKSLTKYRDAMAVVYEQLKQLEIKRVDAVKKIIEQYGKRHQKLWKDSVVTLEEVLESTRLIDARKDFNLSMIYTIRNKNSNNKTAVADQKENSDARVKSMMEVDPVSSPSVCWYGKLHRRTGFLKSWKACCGVLTKDGYLYIFDYDGVTTSGGDKSIRDCILHCEGTPVLSLYMIEESTIAHRLDLHANARDLTDKPTGYLWSSVNKVTLRCDNTISLNELEKHMVGYGACIVTSAE